ncbi:MAG: hypothetical protein EOO11_23300 [Chitinophagaceae bacterium]|nr:MAG: hypothetical protein EOO11_23300 [Chitinophagaceae bacterium]
MYPELHHIELDSLVRMHQSAAFRLQAALLGGATWQEVHDQRELVTQLSIAIQKRRTMRGSPADLPGRSRTGGGENSPADQQP